MVMAKRGQGLSITTLILIIIGVVILVVLIFGFTAGWGNIKEWIAPSNNVDKIVTSCNIACVAEIKADWCDKEMLLKTRDDPDRNVRCQDLVIETRYGVEDCPAIPQSQEGGCVRAVP